MDEYGEPHWIPLSILSCITKSIEKVMVFTFDSKVASLMIVDDRK